MNKEDLLKTASLAKLTLSEEEQEKFTSQLKAVLEYFQKISKINTQKIEPLVHPLDGIEKIEHVRTDSVKNFENTEKLLQLASDRLDREYKVPLVVE